MKTKTKKTTGRNTDAEDALHTKLERAKALVHLIATAANGHDADPRAFHHGLETVWDLLSEAEEAREQVSEVLDGIEWPKPEPEPVKPLDKETAKKAIKAIKGLTKKAKPHWKTLAKQQREAAANGETQSLNLGGAE